MRTKFNIRKTVLLFSILIFSSMLYAGGVLSSPRKVYVISTNHFEIIFPKESAQTANFIAEHADSLYERAKGEVGYQKDFVIPLIISPDSSVLSVEYTSTPYNRIVIFDAVADGKQIQTVHNYIEETVDEEGGGSVLLALLYKEIFEAISCSVRSPFNEYVSKLAFGDPYKPIELINLPFSFVGAYSDLASGAANDRYFQQLLIQAKIEDRFPSWFQTAAIRDIHPGNDLCYAAATGFAAYLMNSRGLEKYIEFWNECGKLHPYFFNGIFYKVYGKLLRDVWKEFEEALPLPENQAQLQAIESLSSEVSENDRQGAFENILYTSYGIVWYDSIRHEVDIFDNSSSFQIRQLLFIADNIEKLSLSPDGRYLTASFTRGKSRPEFKENLTRIFDLKKRSFLEQKLNLRDATFISSVDGSPAIAGLTEKDKCPLLQIYSFEEEKDNGTLLFEKSFSRASSIFSLSAGKEGCLSYILSDAEGSRLVIEEPFLHKYSAWTIAAEDGKQIAPFFMQYINAEDLYSFSYYPEEEGALVRSGYVSLSQTETEGQEQKVYLQNCDISGGVYYPVFAAGRLYYCAKKFSHNELRYLPFEAIPFTRGKLSMSGAPEEAVEAENEDEALLDLENKKLGSYDISSYNVFKYMRNISFTPLLAVRDITIENGPVYWPSLGFYVRADSDPMRNTQLVLSGGIDFLKLSFTKEFNTVPQETQILFDRLFGKTKKYNFAAYIDNSSTPVDISAGALFDFNADGAYDFKGVAKTSWKIPVGNILRDMGFTISSIYSASTDYYDENKKAFHPPMEGWTPMQKSYRLLELAFAMTYSNSHQYGISRYERRGLTLGGRIYSLWDVYEIEQLRAYRDKTKEEIESGENTELTTVQLENIYNENMLNISQLNLGLSALVEIPRLTPLEIKNGWVLSLPTTVSAELMNKNGTALELTIESLLLGNEIQNGFPFLYLFFSRAGLKGGYHLKLEYDTTKVQLPDIRRDNYFASVFSQTELSDSVFVTLDTDLLVPTGVLSQIQFNMQLNGEYYIKTNGFKLTFNVSAEF